MNNRDGEKSALCTEKKGTFADFFWNIWLTFHFGGYMLSLAKQQRQWSKHLKGRFLMEALECIKSRRSVRKYSDQPVTREVLDKIFEAVIYAPSWKNTQSVRYTVVEDPELKAKIAEEAVLGFALNQKTISRCPVLLIQSTINERSGRSPDGTVDTSKGDTWTMYDAGISAQTLCLAAEEYGLGTVIMGVFDEDKLAPLVNLPENQTVTGMIAIGYPAGENKMPPRKPASEIVTYL